MKTHPALSPAAAALVRTIGDRIAPRGKGDGRLCIINYHRVLPVRDPVLDSEPNVETFRWQMELLARCFNVLPLYDAVTMLGTERMPPRAVSITFDDGYRSIHDLALPVLGALKLPATVFVTSGHIDGGNMWNDTIIETVQHLPHTELDMREVGLEVYPLASMADRKQAIDRLTQASKYLSPHERARVTSKLEKMAGNRMPDSLMLSEVMIANLVRHGIEIGGHTVSHPILTRLDDDMARFEIEEGKRQLELATGKPVRLFAYPNGKAGLDFNAKHVQMARDAGYAAAFTTAVGAASRKHDPFQLPRSRPWDKTPFFFALRLLRWLAH